MSRRELHDDACHLRMAGFCSLYATIIARAQIDHCRSRLCAFSLIGRSTQTWTIEPAPVERLALAEPVEANADHEIIQYLIDLPMRQQPLRRLYTLLSARSAGDLRFSENRQSRRNTMPVQSISEVGWVLPRSRSNQRSRRLVARIAGLRESGVQP